MKKSRVIELLREDTQVILEKIGSRPEPKHRPAVSLDENSPDEGESSPMYVGGSWEILSPYGICETVDTEGEAIEKCAYASSKGIVRTYRKKED